MSRLFAYLDRHPDAQWVPILVAVVGGMVAMLAFTVIMYALLFGVLGGGVD